MFLCSVCYSTRWIQTARDLRSIAEVSREQHSQRSPILAMYKIMRDCVPMDKHSLFSDEFFSLWQVHIRYKAPERYYRETWIFIAIFLDSQNKKWIPEGNLARCLDIIHNKNM